LEFLASNATDIGLYAFVVFSVASFAQLLVGVLVDKYPLKLVFGAVAVLQVVFFCLMIPLSGWAALVASIGFMLAVFGQIPINDVLVGRLASSEWRSRAFALRYLVTFSVMASAVPLIAWIHSRWGFSVLFQFLASVAFLILLVVLFLPSLQVPKTTPTT
ncbi:MAG: MFS transporter, partial [Gammaproteobacteria bacterium]|nr:MFS transporter [Gammaproteobacteria bacterium]